MSKVPVWKVCRCLKWMLVLLDSDVWGTTSIHPSCFYTSSQRCHTSVDSAGRWKGLKTPYWIHVGLQILLGYSVEWGLIASMKSPPWSAKKFLKTLVFMWRSTAANCVPRTHSAHHHISLYCRRGILILGFSLHYHRPVLGISLVILSH